MISCQERRHLRALTLQNLARSDWQDAPTHLQIDDGKGKDRRRRQTRCAYLALQAGLQYDADYILFLEDDLDFNSHLRHNLFTWSPLRNRRVTLASLYNPQLCELACDLANRARLVDPACVFGSQSFVISRQAASYILERWHTVPGMQDIKISRLSGRFGGPVFYHAPSLVQHISTRSIWGGPIHRAIDFDPDWRA
jgi:hypothetical protein